MFVYRAGATSTKPLFGGAIRRFHILKCSFSISEVFFVLNLISVVLKGVYKAYSVPVWLVFYHRFTDSCYFLNTATMH